MFSRKQKHVVLKFFSMFSVIRGYNILLILLAQYLAALFIFAPELSLKDVVLDPKLFMLILACAASIAGGYIINNFYDSEKDLINRPNKSMLDKLVSQNTKLSFYFVLNFSAIIMASYVSFRAVCFFSIYIFFIWFYSHKLKRYTFIGNIISALLTITPFFILFIYYKNFTSVIFLHAVYLFLLILIRELVKDLENIKGDLTLNYKTIPIVYGVTHSKLLISFLVFFTGVTIYFILKYHDLGYMLYYFYLSFFLLSIFILLLWLVQSKKYMLGLHNLIKFIIYVVNLL